MRRIMIVDDHPIVRQGLALLITEKGGDKYEVVGTVGCIPEALSMVKRLRPDLVIVDISLEGKDGIDLVKTMKAAGHDSKILMFSMYDENLYAERALAAGADGYIMKQAAPSEIFNAVCQVAEGNVYFSNRIVANLIRRRPAKPEEEVITTADLLTDRELETFRLLGSGWTTQQIANELHLSMKTVETYYAHIKAKLDLHNFNELIQHAVQWCTQDTKVLGH